MTTTLEAVEAAALGLSVEERAELIERLIDTVLPAPVLHNAWAAEIEGRVVELDAGRVETIPADRVLAEMRTMIEASEPKA